MIVCTATFFIIGFIMAIMSLFNLYERGCLFADRQWACPTPLLGPQRTADGILLIKHGIELFGSVVIMHIAASWVTTIGHPKWLVIAYIVCNLIFSVTLPFIMGSKGLDLIMDGLKEKWATSDLKHPGYGDEVNLYNAIIKCQDITTNTLLTVVIFVMVVLSIGFEAATMVS